MGTGREDSWLLRRDRQPVDIRQIRLFVAVAEDRDYGRAAQRMHITQRELAHQIRRLERGLGEPLVERSSRPVRLTPAGDAFLEVAERVVRRTPESGGLRLGAHLPVVATVLSVLLGHWTRRQPAVWPRLTSGRTQELLDLVRSGELDVALVDGPVDDRTLSSVLVLEHKLVMVLPPDHRLARKEAVTFADLRDQQFVAISRRSSTSLHDRFIELCGAAGFHPDVTLEVDDPDLLPMAVAAGLGVGLTASDSVTGMALPGVVWRPVVDEGATLPLVAVSAAEGITPQAQEFLGLVEALRHGSRFLPITTVDLTDPPRALQPVA
jgi:DNA-binding transcriptional LysR family regulator